VKWQKLSCTAVTLLALILSDPFSIQAGELTYTVREGQSLSLICLELYGEKDLYTLVALYNGKDDPTKISAGETLRIPFSDMVTLRKGESLSSLAGRIWRDPKKFPIIAWANDLSDPARVPAGTRLAVPALLPYRLPRGESVSTTAQRFYGDPRQYTPIVSASDIKDPARVPAGSLLMVPYLFPRPTVKSVPKIREKEESASKADRAMVLLEQAEAAYRAGKYGDAWTSGYEALRGLEGKQKARALRLLAGCQYAFRRMTEALDDLKAAYELDPEYLPDPAYVNPEMLELYRKARSQ
jgi:tetratricopeptide (TPR) repeat protein